MHATPNPAVEIVPSWVTNAEAWTQAVRSGGIARRRLATDAAVVRAALVRSPSRVLDLGCGEGWLTRRLSAQGVEVVGIDGSAPLVEAAQISGGGVFLTLTYNELIANPARAGLGFDLVIANFALFTEDLEPLLHALRRGPLAPGRALLIQTVHPVASGGPYRDGWRREDFQGFGQPIPGGWRPMPWYFRTLGSWVGLLQTAGYSLVELHEPLHPETDQPLSLLMKAEVTCTSGVIRPSSVLARPRVLDFVNPPLGCLQSGHWLAWPELKDHPVRRAGAQVPSPSGPRTPRATRTLPI